MQDTGDHARLIEACDAVARDIECSMLSVRVANTDLRELAVAALTSRSLELYRASVHLVRLDMESAARVTLRSLLETVFRGVAVSRDDEALESYAMQEVRDRQRLVYAARTSGTRMLEPLKGEAGDDVLSTAERMLGPNPVRAFSTEDYARRAGLHDWYATAWRSFCWSAHASPMDMTQYFVLNEEGQVTSLLITPPYTGSAPLLATAALSMVYIGRAFDSLFGTNLGLVLDRYETQFAPYVEHPEEGREEERA